MTKLPSIFFRFTIKPIYEAQTTHGSMVIFSMTSRAKLTFCCFEKKKDKNTNPSYFFKSRVIKLFNSLRNFKRTYTPIQSLND